MSATATSRARRIANRITATWAEMTYAQRRTVEIQTGVTGLTGRHGRRTRLQDSQLDMQL